MVAPIKLPGQLTLDRGIPNNPRKIHRRIKRLALQNPLIHLDPRLLPRRIRIRLPVAPKRCDGRPDRLDARRGTVVSNLLERLLQPRADAVLGPAVGAA